MKIYKNIYILFFYVSIVMITSCANLGDSASDLGNGYAYRVDGSDRWIRPDNFMKDGIYPNVIDFKSDSNYIVILQEPTIKGYERFLAQDLRYKYESILAKTDTVKKDDLEAKFLNTHLWKDRNIHLRVEKEIKPNNQTSFEKINIIADSIIEFDPYFKKDFLRKQNYWIINKNTFTVFGPFAKEEYIKMKSNLQINKALKLNNE